MPGYVKVGGAQQPIAAPYVKVGGTWTPVAVGYAKVAGEWKIWHTAEIVDNFNRDNSASLGTASNDFSQWTNPTSNWGIQGNAAYCGSTSTPSVAYTQLYKATTDYKVQIDTPSNTGLGAAFWVTDDNNWWAAIPGVRQQNNPAYYSCPSGFSLSGTICTKVYPNQEPNPGIPSYVVDPAPYQEPIYGCPSGYSLSGGQCRKAVSTSTSEYNATCTASTTYTCPSGYSGGGSSSTCTKTVYASASSSYSTGCASARQCSGSCSSSRSCGNGECMCVVRTVTYYCQSGPVSAGTVCGTSTTSGTSKTTYSCACPQGGSLSNFRCYTTTTNYEYTSQVQTGTRTVDPAPYTVPGVPPYCNAGYTLNGSVCVRTDTQSATYNPPSTSYPSAIRIYASVAGVITQAYTKDISSDPKSMEVSTSGSNINVQLYSAANLGGSRIDSVVYSSGNSLKARGVGIAKNGNQVQRQGIAVDNFRAE